MEESLLDLSFNLLEEKRNISKIGISYFLLLIITIISQFALIFIVRISAEDLLYENWFSFALSAVTLYLIASPIAFMQLKKVPTENIERRKITLGQFIICLIMCISIMQIGNYIGLALTTAIGWVFDRQLINPMMDLVLESNLFLTFVFAVVLAPIFEELLFRKLLIDRAIRYGEGSAILISSLYFALFHGNLFQFFYAFALGAMFAFIYVKTGKLRYSILLHMIINFLGSIVPMLLLKSLNLEALDAIFSNSIDMETVMATVQEALPSLIAYGLYTVIILSLGLAGLILLVVKRKKFQLSDGSITIPKERYFSTVFINAGVILFILGCIGQFIYSLMWR